MESLVLSPTSANLDLMLNLTAVLASPEMQPFPSQPEIPWSALVR